jgi:hypothetical protein
MEKTFQTLPKTMVGYNGPAHMQAPAILTPDLRQYIRLALPRAYYSTAHILPML